ncbi:hypothetical protein [Streptomyces sp. NPDC004728]|uniref:hypothetical protein n=1 Tax=Streptomyces sp. NPDC004728 TaxID=3154289 RepID=UPI0033BF249D
MQRGHVQLRREGQRGDPGIVQPLQIRTLPGGFKQSGYGKDLSAYGFEDCTRIKHVMTSL